MQTRRTFLIAAIALAGSSMSPMAAQTETRAQRDRRVLFERLRNARSEREGRSAEDEIWRMWMAKAPTPAVGEAIAEAMSRREQYDWRGAREILDRVVTDAPDYAEGWNQRAFVRFLQQDLDGALEDVERTLALEPLHFAALSGQALILMQQGRLEPGQKALRRAVEIHPWLKERSMLFPSPGQILPNEGKEI